MEFGKPFLGGASGGMQGGPRRGRSPITGPTLPLAAQASQLRRRAKRRTPRRRSKLRSRAKPSARRAEETNHFRRAGQIAPRAALKTNKKGASLSACPLLYSERICKPQSTTSPLQPPAKPAPRHTQGKSTRPRQRPCQTAAYPRAIRFQRQHPQAWKARADRQGSAKACRRP